MTSQGLVAGLLMAVIAASAVWGQAERLSDEQVMETIDRSFQIYRDGADEAKLDLGARERLEGVLARQRAMAVEHLPKTRVAGTMATRHEIILAAESNAQREIAGDPAFRPLVERMAVNDLLWLVVEHAPPDMLQLLLSEAGVPEYLRLKAEPLAATTRAALLAVEPVDPGSVEQVRARRAALERIHRQFRSALLDLLPPEASGRFIASAATKEWRESIAVLTAMKEHPAIRAGVRPPPEAFISMLSARATWAPADGDYELMAVGEANPTRTVRVKKDDPIGFQSLVPMTPTKGIAGKEAVDLPEGDRLYYWRPSR
jgi:hypothetical protein